MRYTFKAIFYVNGSKERSGIVPIMGRMIINGIIVQFSCKRGVTKAIWDVKGNRTIGKNREAKKANFVLDNIKAQITRYYQRLSDREAFVIAEVVRNAYQDIGTEYETLPRVFNKKNTAFTKRAGKDRVKNTYNKYLVMREYVAEFIRYQYKRSGTFMNELTEEFTRDCYLYLKNVVGLAQFSIWIYSIPLKHIVTVAHYNGKIPRNPFATYRTNPDHKERESLTLDELTAMTDTKLEDPNMAFARNLFILGCWTGVSSIDIKNLTEDNTSMVSSAPWIVSKRQRTGVPFQIELMGTPMQIIERYKSFGEGNHLFNIGNLGGINECIKRAVVMCGIRKRISFHVSHHSQVVLALEYGMPTEGVSKTLGHTNTTITQIYAKVVSTKLGHDITVFESRIRGHLLVMGGMA